MTPASTSSPPGSASTETPAPPLTWRRILRRIIITGIVLLIWFWTQSMIGGRAPAANGIGDVLHNLTAGLNNYFHNSPAAANALLIVSSALIDALGLFLLARWLFAGSVRPFLGLFLLMALRQLMQALCSLPPPPGIIWHYPGFPSALVTYGVANDFFFSGHTAIAVFGAIELARLKRPWLTAIALLIVILEIAAVIILRAHYTMDVFTGLIAALWVASFVSRVSPHLDQLLSRMN